MGGIHAAIAGQTYVDPALNNQLVCNMLGSRAWRRSRDQGSQPREEEVTVCCLGLLGKEIVRRLDISIETVEAHKSNAMHKMHMKSPTDIVRDALLRSWLGKDLETCSA